MSAPQEAQEAREETKARARREALIAEAQMDLQTATQALFNAEAKLARAQEPMAADWVETARRAVGSQAARIADYLQNREEV